MEKIQKKKLCPDDVSPAFGVPSKVGGEWRTDYGPKIFVEVSSNLILFL